MISRIAAFAGGALIGFGAGYIAFEKSLRVKYDEMAEANRRAYEAAKVKIAEAHPPVAVDVTDGWTVQLIEDGRIASINLVPENVVPFDSGLHVVPTEEVLTAESVQNDYARALEAQATPSEDFVEGNTNIYGVSYIEEEEYMEEDGREKLRVDLIMADDNPIFLLGGAPMDDYADRIGESILRDMFTHCPPGVPPILYVRNDRTGEDFEVERVDP